MLESIDPQSLRHVAIGGIILLAVIAVFVAVTVQRVMTKLAIIGIIVGAGALVWWQRAELHDCVATCDCKFFNLDVEMPGDAC